MSLPSLVERIRSALRDGWADPARRYGAIFVGKYRATGNRIWGTVGDPRTDIYMSKHPPSSMETALDGATVGRTTRFEQDGKKWRFEMSVGCEVTSNVLLEDRLRVYAVDRLGGRSALRLEGADELAHIRKIFGARSELELAIDFSGGGNCQEYLREGWYPPEPRHTWTQGTHSVLELPLAAPGSRYGVGVSRSHSLCRVS